jgi:adenine-specific DNA-methyltransferase
LSRAARRSKGAHDASYSTERNYALLDVAAKLDAYEHKEPWTYRLILSESCQVINSLLEYEGMSCQVQVIYFDPSYGVKFG